ncbi:primase-helicase zinc-binding domain-containing protein [Mesorhizobium sp. M0898]|uniref:DUF7146 domain-containing protein n=1 Tax=Mesorhizobium sp. M0898 TaxID=2957020 RepID=UPI0033383533
MTEKLRDKARGRWRGILSGIGIPDEDLTGRHRPCPICGGKDRFRFDDKDGNGTWICSQCGAGDGVHLVMKKNGVDFKTAATLIERLIGMSPVHKPKKTMTVEEQRTALARLWRSATDITAGDPVDRYLRNRGLGCDAYPTALQFAPRAKHLDGDDRVVSWHPAMLAALADVDGNPINIHRTYLTHDGRKAHVVEPRKMMPGLMPAGACVRLHPISTTGALGIAEGIETALAATALFEIPCWSALNSTGIEKWIPPQGVTEVVIFGDNDAKFGGHAAAFALAHRLAIKGLIVHVEIPTAVGEDWNDVLAKHKGA